jgi:hypothetical protein
MSAVFYDKEDIKFDNQLQSINDRLNQIQASFRKERKYLNHGFEVYRDHYVGVDKRIASLLREESKWAGLATLVGTAVGALAVWELIRDVRGILRWIGDKMAKQEQQVRLHARDWNY